MIAGARGAVALALAAVGARVLGRRLALPLGGSPRGRTARGRGLSARAPTQWAARGRRIADALNDTADPVRAVGALAPRFAADASHQLRTPLTALRLRLDEADAALEEGHSQAARNEVRIAVVEAARLTKIVSDLLLLTRTPGQQPLREPVVSGRRGTGRSHALGAGGRDAGTTIVAEPGGGSGSRHPRTSTSSSTR